MDQCRARRVLRQGRLSFLVDVGNYSMKILRYIGAMCALIGCLSAQESQPTPPVAPPLHMSHDQMDRVQIAQKDAQIAKLQGTIADLATQLILAQACAAAKLPVEECQISPSGVITAKSKPPETPAPK